MIYRHRYTCIYRHRYLTIKVQTAPPPIFYVARDALNSYSNCRFKKRYMKTLQEALFRQLKSYQTVNSTNNGQTQFHHPVVPGLHLFHGHLLLCSVHSNDSSVAVASLIRLVSPDAVTDGVTIFYFTHETSYLFLVTVTNPTLSAFPDDRLSNIPVNSAAKIFRLS